MTKLIKLSLLSLALVLVSTLAVSNVVLAQETEAEDSAEVILDETITAEDLNINEPVTGVWGFLKSVGFGLQYAFTFNPVKKAELKLDHASEALIRAQHALEVDPESFKARENYEKYLDKFNTRVQQLNHQVQNIKDKAPFNPKVEQFLNKLTDTNFKQQRLMDHVSGLLNDDQRAKLVEAREESLKTLGEALKNLDDAGNLPARLENALNLQEQGASRLIHLKNLEVIQGLKNQMPENYMDILHQAEELSIDRLNAAIQNINPQARQDRFHAYMENSGSDPLFQLEALETLEDAPATIHDLRGYIPALKNDKVERLNEVVDELQEDIHNVRYLERVREQKREGDNDTQ